MAFHDCDVEEADILEVQSVSDMFSAFKTPAADAVKLIGGDDIAVFSPQLGLMAVTSQYDLEEPATTSQTVILSLADAECTWPDPPEYISDIVFECRWPSGANLVTEFQTFSDENATPSPSLEHYRERFSEGGICTVFSECDEAYLLDLKGKRDASRVDNQDRIPIARKHPAADTASPAVLEIEPGEICAPYIVAKQRFISQVFTNKSPVRTMDDLDETVLSLAQMKQIAEGDPTVAERMDVENKIGQLKLMMASHLEGLADVQHKIETQYRPLVEALTSQRDMLADDEVPFAEADLVRQQTLGSKDSSLTVGGTHIADKEEAIRALRRAAYGVRPGCEEIIGTYRGLSVVCRRQHVLDDDWLPYIGLAVDAAKHVHMSDRVFPSGEKGAFTVLTQMDRIIAQDAKGPAEIELKLREAQHALADAQKAAKEPFPKQAELDEAEQRLAVLEQERIEAEAQRQREQAQRAEAEAAAIEEGVEDEREAARVAELRRQGLICEDSATHDAATASPNGIASGGPDDVYEAARRSAAASVREERDGGEKHKAGM